MIDFGYTLRQAREQKGLTTRQVADSTHMMERMVIDLENEEFGNIAAPIYGRGFVKLYCEAVGLDPKPLVAEFMEIFNGNRPATIRRRPEPPSPEAPSEMSVAHETTAPSDEPPAASVPAPEPKPMAMPEPEPVAAPEPAPVVEPEPAPAAAPEIIRAPQPPAQEDSLFAFAQRPAATSIPPSEPKPAPAPMAEEDSLGEGFARLAAGPSRYAAPMPIDDNPRRGFAISVPPVAWRIMALSGAALLVLWLLITLLRALSAALTGAPTPTETPATSPAAAVETAPQQQAPAPAATARPAPRKPMEIPPLYID